ncbi:MAG: glycosyltransferase, partial [Planctomycetota bacterium]
MAVPPLVSIIVLACDKARFTERCLSAVLGTEYPSVELFLVNNGSTDATGDLLERAARLARRRQGWRAEVLHFSANIGAVAGRNAALKNVRGDYVVFLDNDVAVGSPGWLQRSVARLEREPRLGALGPKLVFPKPEGVLQCAGCAVTPSGRVQFVGRGESAKAPKHNVEREVQCLISACLVLRRTVVDAVGFLDMAYHPVQYEDIDYCYRIRERGYRVLYYPEVVAYHYENVTTDATPGINYRYLTIKNGLTFKERWRHRFRVEGGPPDAEAEWKDLPRVSWEELDPVPPFPGLEEAPVSPTASPPPSTPPPSESERASPPRSEEQRGGDFPPQIEEEPARGTDSMAWRLGLLISIVLMALILIRYREPIRRGSWATLREALWEPFSQPESTEASRMETARGPRGEKPLLLVAGTSEEPADKAPLRGGIEKAGQPTPGEFPRPWSVGEEPLPVEEAPSGEETAPPLPVVRTPEAGPGTPPVDWRTRAITGFVPRANVVVYLKRRVLLLRSHADIVRIYQGIAVAGVPGPKQAQGDGRSPVGLYRISDRTRVEKGTPVLMLNYPNAGDADAALAAGRITQAQHQAIRAA